MNLEKTVNQDINRGLRKSVLSWLETMRVGPYQYRMNAGSDSSIFTSCFALFIMHLFGSLNSLSDREKDEWARYIKGFQDKQSGLFIGKNIISHDAEKLTRQLTCFCLSALDLLGTKPDYPLVFMDSYKTPEDIKKYLYDIGCHRGLSGTGNKAMFLAIFLTYLVEYQKDDYARAKLDMWFDWHDKCQNPRSGFWGDGKDSFYYHGLQNGFHQLLVYFYWGRPIRYLNKIISVTLKTQDRQGFFAPTRGGGGCWDYDAIHVLTNFYRTSDLNKDRLTESLRNAYNAIMSTQNSDGGFCQSKRKPKNLIDLLKYFSFLTYGDDPNLWYERFKKTLILLVKKREMITTGWTKNSRRWEESNLWDTWVRCLSLGEISSTIDLGNLLQLEEVRFHRMIGLGYF